MDTSDLVRILSTDRRAAPLFAGALPRDSFVELAREARRDYAVVFNTHASHQPGEHWIAYVRLNGRGRYFDSYGRPPDAYPDVALALRDSRPPAGLVWNGQQLQGLTTTACGDYCVLFTLLACRGWTTRRFVERMLRVGGFERRDHAVRALVLRLYGQRAITTLRHSRNADDADNNDNDDGAERYIGRDRLHVASAVRALNSMPSLADIRFLATPITNTRSLYL
jgi:hypothetical protein